MSDIRQLLEAAKADPPPPAASVDDIVRAGRRRLRKSRAGAFGGAGLGVAAVVAALLMAAPGTPASTLGAAATTPPPAPFTLTYAGYRVGAFEVTDPMHVTPGYQQSLVQRSGVDLGGGVTSTLDAGTLTVYAAGVFRPDRYAKGTTIELGGRTAYAALLDHTFTIGGRRVRGATTTQVTPLPAIAWQYADGAWATLASDDLGQRGIPAEALRRLADAFTVGEARPATAAFKAAHIPPGWELASVGRSLVGGDPAVSRAVWVRTGTRFDALTEPLDLNTTPAILVSVSPVETEGPYAHPVNPPCPAGQHFCDIRIDGRFYAEVQDISRTLSAAEIAQIAQGLEFAAPDRPGAWFRAS
ncbi:hypothetical protein [Asanoa sp. NPDC050611]|uniref:hypothetical protein n=1 Tax=Asanoa sp. NPDC050611 TaxID=3157098 RepID=UPI0033E9E46B